MLPRSGDVVRLGRNASPQFQREPLLMRMVRVLDWTTNDETWVWLDGYQLDASGDATERRQVYVSIAGIEVIAGTPLVPATLTPHRRNAGPAAARARPPANNARRPAAGARDGVGRAAR